MSDKFRLECRCPDGRHVLAGSCPVASERRCYWCGDVLGGHARLDRGADRGWRCGDNMACVARARERVAMGQPEGPQVADVGSGRTNDPREPTGQGSAPESTLGASGPRLVATTGGPPMTLDSVRAVLDYPYTTPEPGPSGNDANGYVYCYGCDRPVEAGKDHDCIPAPAITVRP